MRRYGFYSAAIFFVLLLLIVVQNYYSTQSAKLPPNDETITPGGPTQQTEFLFCHWNVENLFDDQDDGRKGPGDKEYDPLFANNPALLREKLDRLSEAILKMNNGKGPDILALVEVESIRAAELLQKHLNDKLDPSLHYRNLLMKEIAGGRHIAPAILTRLRTITDRTRTLGSRQRILQGHIVVNDQELIVIASHWSSRLKDSGEAGRDSYANKIYGACKAMYINNPAVDFLICGDFNDDPDDSSITEHLHAVGARDAVLAGNPLQLLNLMAGKDPSAFGTLYYKKWHIFDQIVVAPGMLDSKGWTCDPDSVRVVNDLYRPRDKQKRPWRFGGAHEKGERGYSDHFPVTVKLRVERAATRITMRKQEPAFAGAR